MIPTCDLYSEGLATTHPVATTNSIILDVSTHRRRMVRIATLFKHTLKSSNSCRLLIMELKTCCLEPWNVGYYKRCHFEAQWNCHGNIGWKLTECALSDHKMLLYLVGQNFGSHVHSICFSERSRNMYYNLSFIYIYTESSCLYVIIELELFAWLSWFRTGAVFSSSLIGWHKKWACGLIGTLSLSNS